MLGPTSEDCLSLQIFRPPAHARQGLLPVAVSLHGGGWTFGSSSLAQFNGTNLVMRSVELGEPILVVGLNYRLGAL